MTYKYIETIDSVHGHGIDVENRELFLFPREEFMHGAGSPELDESAIVQPGIEFSVANQFLKNIRYLQNESDDPILIHLKTCGGDWIEGISIYNAIRFFPGQVTILNYAEARSMSSIIFLAGDERVMMPYSWFMFHEGDIAFGGTARQFRTATEMAAAEREQMLEIYLARARGSKMFAGQSDAAVIRWLKAEMARKEDVYLTPEQAIDAGFATKIFEGWDSL